MKSKILLTLTLVIAIFSTSIAEIIYPETATNVARNFFYERMVQTGTALNVNDIELQLVREAQLDGMPAYYAYDIVGGGFVIVAGDDAFSPIIGYSPEGKFPANDLGQNFGSFMTSYTEQIAFIRAQGIQPDDAVSASWNHYNFMTSAQMSPAGSRDMEPLISILWNQDYPYNAYCPEDDAGPGGHVYAGCVATAMSIIMQYYRYPEHGTGSKSYNYSPYGTISANFGETYYDWDAMTSSIGSGSGRAINAIAELQFHCGVSVRMMYGNDGSGAYSDDVPAAIKNYFGYSTTAQHISKYYYNSTNWENIIFENIDALKPLYYSGQSDDGGHAFVLDGYQNTSSGNLFHFNFGWSGSGNGYYTLTDVNGFNSSQAMVRNFFPNPANYPYECTDHVITSPLGSFEDRSGPLSNYQANSHCTWLIQPEDSVTSISLQFDRFDLGAGDVVNVYDGTSASAPMLVSYNRDASPELIESTGNGMFLELISDGSENGNGFSAEFESNFPTYCTSSTVTYNEPEGYISDGSGPHRYNNSTLCKWKIDPGPFVKDLTLVFTQFDLEDGVDFLNVYAIPNNQVIGHYTGSTLPEALVSPTGKMLLVLTTNGFNNYQGFEAEYYILNVASNDQIFAKNLSVFPNPASGYTNIKFNLDEAATVQFGIYNLLGQQLYSHESQLPSGYVDQTLQLGKLSPGVYVLRLSSPKGSVSQRLVIH